MQESLVGPWWSHNLLQRAVSHRAGRPGSGEKQEVNDPVCTVCRLAMGSSWLTKAENGEACGM